MQYRVKRFDPLPVKNPTGTNKKFIMSGIPLGFFELFRKFYSVEKYYEVVQKSCVKLAEDPNAFLEVFSSLMCS